MKIKMKVTTKGSPNGIKVLEYEKDQVYDLNEDLANVFLKMGVAEIAAQKKEKVIEKKAENAAPKNKAYTDYSKELKSKR